MDERERSPWATAVGITAKAERTARGMSQDEMVRRSGISKSALRRIEGNDRVADVTQIWRVAEALGLTLPEFFQRAATRHEDILSGRYGHDLG
jgi:transcriptional regulator with XRE-family HTH domain